MSQQAITMVRVYLAEGRDDVGRLTEWLEQQEVRGFSVFRGVAGLGSDGHVHKASLLDLSSRLPVVIEFFDSPEKIAILLNHIEQLVKSDTIVQWPASTGI